LGLAFGSAAAGFLGAALLLVGLAGSFRAVQSGPPTRIDQEIREGIAFLVHHDLLRTVAVVVALINLAQGAVWALLVLYAVAPGPMGLSEVGFGLLLTTSAAGLIAGTLIAGTLEQRLGRPNLLLACVISLAAGSAALALSTDPFLIGATYAVGGIFLGGFNVTYQSLRQRVTPDRILGRVVATFRMLGWGALPLGAAVGGLIGEAYGLTAVFAGSTVATLALVPARLLVTEARIARAEAAAAEDRRTAAAAGGGAAAS
jgi:MFS family permease